MHPEASWPGWRSESCQSRPRGSCGTCLGSPAGPGESARPAYGAVGLISCCSLRGLPTPSTTFAISSTSQMHICLFPDMKGPCPAKKKPDLLLLLRGWGGFHFLRNANILKEVSCISCYQSLSVVTRSSFIHSTRISGCPL